MNKLNLSVLAAALALATSAWAGEGNKPVAGQTPPPSTAPSADLPVASPTADIPASPPIDDQPMTHGQTVSQTAQATEGGEAVSTVAHSVRDFKKLDADKDGFVTQVDVQSDVELSQQFADWDDDKDLKLSQSEFDAYVASTVTLGDEEPEEEAE